MPRRDDVEFTLAFLLGSVLGIGLVTILRPEPRAARRVSRRVKPARRRVVKSAREARRSLSDTARRTRKLGHELGGLGQETTRAIRDEAGSMVREAGRGFLEVLTQRVRKLGSTVKPSGRRPPLMKRDEAAR